VLQCFSECFNESSSLGCFNASSSAAPVSALSSFSPVAGHPGVRQWRRRRRRVLPLPDRDRAHVRQDDPRAHMTLSLDCDGAASLFESIYAVPHHPSIACVSSSTPCRSVTHCCGALSLQFLPDDRQVAAIKGIPHLTTLTGFEYLAPPLNPIPRLPAATSSSQAQVPPLHASFLYAVFCLCCTPPVTATAVIANRSAGRLPLIMPHVSRPDSHAAGFHRQCRPDERCPRLLPAQEVAAHRQAGADAPVRPLPHICSHQVSDPGSLVCTVLYSQPCLSALC